MSMEFDEMWDKIENGSANIKLLIGGRTRVGKSSLLNALMKFDIKANSDDFFDTDVIPCNRYNKEIIWFSSMGNISLIDVPGFGEANAPDLNNKTYKENMLITARDAHIFILVLKADDYILDNEINFIREWNKDKNLSKIPMIIAINQIDKIAPTRFWKPGKMNLLTPKTEKELNICRVKEAFVSRCSEIKSLSITDSVVMTSAEEGEELFGIEHLCLAIERKLPDAVKIYWIQNKKNKTQKAYSVVLASSMASLGISFQPFPLIDNIMLLPVQFNMFVQIFRIYKFPMTKNAAFTMLSSILGLILTNQAVILATAIVPIAKQTSAFTTTFLLGMIISELLRNNNLNPSHREIEALISKYKEEAHNQLRLCIDCRNQV